MASAPPPPCDGPLSPTKDSKAKGAVLGLAWGEARSGGPGRATLQALALAGASLEHRPWALGAWVCWLLAGQREGVWRDGDRFLEEALMRLRRGEPPERTGFPTPRIGPAARVGPLGVLLRGDPASLLTATLESSLVTHADLRAGVFAFAVAYAVARLVDGDEPVDVVAVLPDAVRGVEESWTLPRQPLWERDHGAPHAVSETMREVFHAFPPKERAVLDPAQLRARVVLQARPHMAKHGIAHPNGPFVLLGGMHALSMALLSPLAPGAVLDEIAAQGGGEAALVGAIAGTILGARYGTDWVGDVPDRVRRWADAIARGVRAEDRDEFVRAG